MAKFTQEVNIPQTQEEINKTLDFIKSNLEKFKNPFASVNPFKDGEKLEFLAIVPVKWKHEKFGEGEYLALSFKDKKDTISLTSFTKEVNGFKSLDLSDNTLKSISNPDEGLAKLFRSTEWNESAINSILKWFEDKNNKCEVKLTTYYISQGASRKTCTLTNLV